MAYLFYCSKLVNIDFHVINIACRKLKVTHLIVAVGNIMIDFILIQPCPGQHAWLSACQQVMMSSWASKPALDDLFKCLQRHIFIHRLPLHLNKIVALTVLFFCNNIFQLLANADDTAKNGWVGG